MVVDIFMLHSLDSVPLEKLHKLALNGLKGPLATGCKKNRNSDHETINSDGFGMLGFTQGNPCTVF